MVGDVAIDHLPAQDTGKRRSRREDVIDHTINPHHINVCVATVHHHDPLRSPSV